METKVGLFYFGLIAAGIVANIGMTGFLRSYTRFLHGNRGSTEGEGGGEAQGGEGDGSGRTFTQEDVNRIIANERRTIEGRYQGYDELKQFKDEHEKQLSAAEQKRLEEQGKYEEAKKHYEGKISEISTVISQKDQTITQLKVGFAIQNEVASQGAYPDAVALIQSNAVVGDDGVVRIKGKDANGLDTLVDVKTGVEQFLKSKPYLVKAGAGGGSGSGAGTGEGQGGSGQGGGQDLAALSSKLMAARAAGDHKTARDTTEAIKRLQSSRGISSNI